MSLWRFFCFFKQKTAYEMRISDWSSDVCSSDLEPRSSSGELVRHRGDGRGAAHGQSAAVRRTARLYRQPCRGPDAVLRCGLSADRRKVEGAASDRRAFRAVRRAGAGGISFLSGTDRGRRSEEHPSELQSLMRISYAVFCLKKK